MSRFAKWLLLVSVVMSALAAPARAAPAAPAAPLAPGNIITVDRLLDTPDPSKCRLRDAIIAANTNTAINGCPAGAPGMDTINFSLPVFCQVSTCAVLLTSALPTVSQDLTINGASRLVISGANLYQIFNFGSVVVNLLNLSVVAGTGIYGGGITMNGTTLTLNNVRVQDNHASYGSGVYQPSGTLYVFNSRFIANAAETY